MVLVTVLFMLSGCVTEEESPLSEEGAKRQEEWEEALNKVHNDHLNLGKAISRAEDYVEAGIAEEIEELAQALEEARKVYEENDLESVESADETLNYEEEAFEEKIAKLEENADALEAAKEKMEALNDSYEQLQKEKKSFNPTVTASVIGKDPTGVQIKATVELSSWMKGDDMERLNAVWDSAGGNQDWYPEEDRDFPISDEDINSEMKNSIVLIGKISYENLTPDFNPQIFQGTIRDFYDESLDRESMSVYEKFGPDFQKNLYMSSKWNDSSAIKAYATMTTSGASKPNDSVLYLPSPGMEGKKIWGPTPFAIVYGNYLTADTPEGNPRLDYIRFELGMSDNMEVEETVIITPVKE